MLNYEILPYFYSAESNSVVYLSVIYFLLLNGNDYRKKSFYFCLFLMDIKDINLLLPPFSHPVCLE